MCYKRIPSRVAGRLAIIAAMTMILAATTVESMPPHSDLVEKVAAGSIPQPYFLRHLDQLRARGIGSGDHVYESKSGVVRTAAGRVTTTSGPFRILAIVVEFSDHPAVVSATFFDSLIFGTVGNTVADYYDEISYGQLDIVTVNLPSSRGWQTAPQTYEWYVNGQNGTGNYPRNSQKLVEDLVDQIDPQVDFSLYDNDGDGYVDILLVIHSGTGAELSGRNSDIWSHKWGIAPHNRDGVNISSYTIQPEFWTIAGDMTIGVVAHELGHSFGLPDLYDLDYSSHGIGRWGIMSYGSWLGPRGLGGSPACPCAWSRIKMGFAVAENVAVNSYSQAIGAVENGGSIFRLWNSGAASDEYFLVENRQRTGYDRYLSGSGLLVWHIDDSRSGNSQEWWPGHEENGHYLVALEQADGLYELEHGVDYSDAGDPYPGAVNATVFSAMTTPASATYEGEQTLVEVDNISASAAVMYADLIVGLSAGSSGDDDDPLLPVNVELAQNYPNPFNPVTTISFSTTATTRTTLEIFNLLGQKVKLLFDGNIDAGTISVSWDGCDHNGHEVASGIYFYRLITGNTQQVRKMILLR